jgi:predicted DNA-binding transcriptional regulator YafY
MSLMTTIQTIEPQAAPDAAAPEVRTEGAWRVYPLERALELHYRDVTGYQSRRRVQARELKVGPGKTLLGAIDTADDGYRGFRADRIDAIVDRETGQTVYRNILDWLIALAMSQEKERRRARRRA